MSSGLFSTELRILSNELRSSARSVCKMKRRPPFTSASCCETVKVIDDASESES